MKNKPTSKPKLEVGQKAIFINDYGVNWGEVTITEYVLDEVRGHTYHYVPTDTPWYNTEERNLFAVDEIEAITAATIVKATHRIKDPA